jgi:hypothetical protein
MSYEHYEDKIEMREEPKYFKLIEFIIKQQVEDGIPKEEIIENLELFILSLKKTDGFQETI